MPTTFNWIYLGNVGTQLDPTEGNDVAENANLFVGQTYGSTGTPLYNSITSVTTINNGGNATALDMNNNVVNDQFTTNVGSGAQTFTMDATAIYNATLTYADGTTATITAVVVQSTTGEFFLAPEFSSNTDTTAQEFKPIVSLRLDSVNGNTYSGLTADRVATAWDNAVVDGTSGNDLINASYIEPVANGSDRIDNNDGGVGVGANDDLVRAGAGADTVYSGLGADTVYGGTGNDVLFGGDGNDLLYGEDNNDSLSGDIGNDTLYGGLGLDTLSGGDGNDVLYGDGGNDTLNGDIGNDLAYGGDGDDQVNGGAGLDTLYGGLGNDTMAGGTEADLLDGGGGNDQLSGDGGNDTLTGDTGLDSLYGGAGADQLYGGADADLLDGGGGADSLYGGTGVDTLYGGTGADLLDGGDGGDLIDGGADQDTILGGIGDTVTGGGTGVDQDVLDLTAWGKALTNIHFDSNNPENGTVDFLDADGNVIGTMSFTDIETVVPCFTPGTQVLTPSGPRAVEALCEGDLVLTRDNGLQAIRWIGTRHLSLAELVVRPQLRPVQISRGALGPGLPSRDMMVSPQHRMLIEGAQPEMLFGEPEVLVAATHLCGRHGVSQVLAPGITYIHLMFDQHEIVNADGCWTESFQPGGAVLNGMAKAQRDELLELFPELQDDPRAYPAARPTLRGHEARVLLAA